LIFGYVVDRKTFLIDSPHFAIPWGFKELLEQYEKWDIFTDTTWEALQALERHKDYILAFARGLNRKNEISIPYLEDYIDVELASKLSISKKELFRLIVIGNWENIPKIVIELLEK